MAKLSDTKREVRVSKVGPSEWTWWTDNPDYKQASVPTLHGLASVHIYPEWKTPSGVPRPSNLCVSFIFDGRLYELWRKGKRFTRRGSITIARRFVNEVVAGVHQ